MDLVALIILLISLALAFGAGYWFLQWKCPTRLEKLTQIAQEINEIKPEDETKNFDEEADLSALTSQEIRQKKLELNKGLKKIREEFSKFRKEIKEENDEDEKAKKEAELESGRQLEKKLAELIEVAQPVEEKEDLEKKVYGMWDYAFAGGIAVGVFLISGILGNLISKKMKGSNE